MATTRDLAGSLGWAAAPAGAEDAVFGDENVTRELAPPQNQQLCPKQRLRWTTELHEQFVKAVADLGGANKATPKSISELMGVEGITLFHIKSHLQKFRLGKTGRKLRKEEFIPLNYYRKRDDILPLVNQRAHGSSTPSEFNINGSNTAGAETYGNLHVLVENPQAAAEKFGDPEKIPGQNTNEEASTSGSKPVEATKPALLPLFPTCEWPEYLHARGQNVSVENSHHSDNIFKSFSDQVTTSDNAPNPHLSAPQYHP